MPPRYFWPGMDAPIEQGDLLEDVQRAVDIHRRSRWDLNRFVQPTIEIRRQDDIFVQSLVVTPAAVVGQFSAAQLQNDQTAYNLRLVACWFSPGVGAPATAFSIRSNSSILLATTSGLNRVDTRRQNVGLGVVRTGAQVATDGLFLAEGTCAVNTPFFVPDALLRQLVLGPQGNLTVWALTANQGFDCNFACQVEPVRKTRDKLLGF